jgi:hypothetical protein
VAGRAAGAAGERREPCRDRGRARGPVAAGPGGCRAQGPRGLRTARRPRAGDDAARLPGAGRDAAGDRAGRGPAAHHVDRPARRPARRPVPPADRWQPHRAAAAPDAARGGRLELGAADRRRAGGPAQAVGVRGRGGPGRGRAGLCGCRRVPGGRARTAHRADREVAAGRRGRPRPALPDARHHQGVRRAASRGRGRNGPGAPGPPRVLHRARRDRGAAPAARRTGGVARHARGRPRQPRFRDARCAGGG